MTVPQREFRQRGGVLSARNDERFGKGFANPQNEVAGKRPFQREHDGDADDLGISGNTRNDLRVIQPMQKAGGQMGNTLIMGKGHAKRVHDRNVMARHQQGAGEVGDTQWGRRILADRFGGRDRRGPN